MENANENRDILLFSDDIFSHEIGENGMYVGFPKDSGFIDDVVALCKKHNIKWTFSRGD